MEKEKIIRQMAQRLLAGAQPFPFGICRFELLVCNHVVHGFTDALCAGGM